jgi:hypothetical protein
MNPRSPWAGRWILLIFVGLLTIPTLGWSRPQNVLDRLGNQSRCTLGDAVCVAAIYANLWKPGMEAAGAHRALVDAGLLRAHDATDFNHQLSRGVACWLMMRASKARGGWVSRLIGPTPRYAYKDFAAKNFVAPHGPNTPISGPELRSMLRLMNIYRDQKERL